MEDKVEKTCLGHLQVDKVQWDIWQGVSGRVLKFLELGGDKVELLKIMATVQMHSWTLHVAILIKVRNPDLVWS